MELIDNITRLLGDDLKATLKPKSRLKIAASCFSMYAFEALKAELEKIEELDFIFTSPTFTASEVTDKIRKERKEFHIPKLDRERSLYGSEFEIQLRNKLTQRAIAKECADWMRRKARFKSNRTKAPMQPFAVVQDNGANTAYMPLHGFTAVDLGYQQGNAVSNLVNKMDEPAFAATYLSLFDQIWNDPEKLEDVTAQICEHIASVYQENSPESIYFLMLYNIFNEFLDEIDEDDRRGSPGVGRADCGFPRVVGDHGADPSCAHRRATAPIPSSAHPVLSHERSHRGRHHRRQLADLLGCQRFCAGDALASRPGRGIRHLWSGALRPAHPRGDLARPAPELAASGSRCLGGAGRPAGPRRQPADRTCGRGGPSLCVPPGRLGPGQSHDGLVLPLRSFPHGCGCGHGAASGLAQARPLGLGRRAVDGADAGLCRRALSP